MGLGNDPSSRPAPDRLLRVSGPATALLLVLFLAVSWFPFVPDLPARVDNQVEVTEDGLRFSPVGVALVPDGRDWLADADDWPVRLRLTLRSGSRDQVGPARLLTLGDDLRNQAVIVGQDEADLVVRSMQSAAGRTSSSTLRARDAVDPGRWQDLEVVLERRSATLKVDGVHAEGTFPDVRARIRSGSQLALGAEPSGQRAWHGEIASATLLVDDARLDLIQDDRLEIPSQLWRLPDRLAESGRRSPQSELRTAGWHLALSLALGAGLALWHDHRRPPTRPLLLWAAVAVAANLAKVGFACRHPSLATTLLQVAGGWLGIVAGTLIARGGRARTRREA